MKQLKIIHAADLHLDTPFEGLSSGKAMLRRNEQRGLLSRLAILVREEKADLVLLAGDLIDSDNYYYETGEQLVRCMREMAVPVIITPGNHDYYTEHSPYAELNLPDNVYVFRENRITAIDLPGIETRVYGAAFTDRNSASLLRDYHRADDSTRFHVLCMHGEFGNRKSVYNPVLEEQIAESHLDYVALGHTHTASGLRRAGETYYSWPGCPEGRGFDETGEKTVNIITLTQNSCELKVRSIAQRKYETLFVDISEEEPIIAVNRALPDETISDIYRIVFTGEAETPPQLTQLQNMLESMFFELQLRDATTIRRNVWDKAGEDTLKGIFLRKLKVKYEEATTESERHLIEQAARWGLAALDNMEEIKSYEN